MMQRTGMVPRISRQLARLALARDGGAAIEFAIVAPVFMILVLGGLDVGQMAYARASLSGAVEKAARSASMEAPNTAALDAMVKNEILPIVPNATIKTTRKSYYDFADVERAEKFTDTNHDGTCNAGEPYVDENGSGVWEKDIGDTNGAADNNDNGGAGDVVLYTVTVTYKPIFTANLLGNYSDRTMTAVGVRKNQPYGTQEAYGKGTGTCT